MPQVTGTVIEDNGSVSTSFTGTATTSTQTFTFTEEQNGMRFQNKGNAVITLTIEGTAHNIPAKAVIEIDDGSFASFDVRAASGTCDYEAKSFVTKTAYRDQIGIWSGSVVRGIETTYTGDQLTTVKEKDASNGTITQTTIAYHPDGRVNTVTEIISGTTYLTTLNYVNGELDPVNPVTRSVI